MRRTKFATRFGQSNSGHLLIAIIALIFAIMLSAGCVTVSRSEADEPEWIPTVFKPITDGSFCGFAWNDKSTRTNHLVTCGEISMPCPPNGPCYLLIEDSDLVTLKSKLQQCETWR